MQENPAELRLAARDSGAMLADFALVTAGPAQKRALESVAQGVPTLAYGPPRSGKSSLCAHAAWESMRGGVDPRAVVLLAPTRERATFLREELSRRAMAERAAGAQIHLELPTVMTPLAYAFALVSEEAARNSRAQPSLVTGADQDALLEELLAQVPAQWPESIDPAAIPLAGFRAELRDLLNRCTERGLGPRQLAELGKQCGRKEWTAAAPIFEAYLDSLALEGSMAIEAGARLDLGVLVDRACAVIENAEALEFLAIDDAQDFTASGVRIVTALAARSGRCLVTSNPDATVEGFRGGMADAASRVASALASDSRSCAVVTLEQSYAQEPALSRVVATLALHLPLEGAPTVLRKLTHEEGVADSFALATASSDEAEARDIATAIRLLAAVHGVSRDDIAVVCRSASAARALAERLSRVGIDAEATLRATALREEPVIRDLFAILAWALGIEQLRDERLVEILRGPWGGIDDGMVRELRRWALSHSAHTRGDAAILSILNDAEVALPAPAGGAVEPESGRERYLRAVTAPLRRLRRMRDAIVSARDSGILPLLWAAWEASHLAARWQNEAIAVTASVQARSRAQLANARLDALGALFTAADRYEERRGGDDIAVFMSHIEAQAVPEDSLSARGRVSGIVRVLTPAAVAGESFDTVILAGLNEGAWPNLRLRSGVLGAADLALFVDRPGPMPNRAELRAMRRNANLHDEIRLAVAALSRARNRVLVTAVENDESAPSGLFRVLESAVQCEVVPCGRVASALHSANPGPFPESRQLVSALARALASESADPSHLAGLLTALEREGIESARPENWYHQPLTRTDPPFPSGSTLALSPSSLATAAQCPRAFLLESAGARTSGGTAQEVGTLIHALAEAHPRAGAAELVAEFAKRGPEGEEAEQNWRTRAERARIVQMLEKLGAYQSAHPDVAAVEKRFSVPLGETIDIRGSIDRIEREAGGLRVVDYKTGKSAQSKVQAERDPQLAAYQYALAHMESDEPVVGASLVYVGTDAKSSALRHQAPLGEGDDPDWFENLVREIDARLRSARVNLVRNPHCKVCPVKRSCPLFQEEM